MILKSLFYSTFGDDNGKSNLEKWEWSVIKYITIIN